MTVRGASEQIRAAVRMWEGVESYPTGSQGSSTG